MVNTIDKLDVNSLPVQRDPLYRVIFSTNAKMRANENEFVIKFGFIDRADEYFISEQISIVLTPQHAQRFYEALGRTIEQRKKRSKAVVSAEVAKPVAKAKRVALAKG